MEHYRGGWGRCRGLVFRSPQLWGTGLGGSRVRPLAKSIGRDYIEVNVRNDLSGATERLIAERDENTCRKDFTPSEAVALGRRLEELERPKAGERKAEAGKANLPTSGAESTPLVGKGKTRDKVAEAIGIGRTKYEQAKRVVEAAEEGDPVAEEAVGEKHGRGIAPAESAEPISVGSKRDKAGEAVGMLRARVRGEAGLQPVGESPTSSSEPPGTWHLSQNSECRPGEAFGRAVDAGRLVAFGRRGGL